MRDDPSLRDGVPCPEDLNVEVLDVLDFGRMRMNGDKMASMFTGPTRPIYDLTWRYTLTGRLLWAGGTAWSRIMFPRFTEHVRKAKPLAIVCTHITAANVAVGARMITGQSFPIVCVPTDYETEGLWPHLHSDLFCVANESMAETRAKCPKNASQSRASPRGPRSARPTTRPQDARSSDCRRTSASYWRSRARISPRPTCAFEKRLTRCFPTCTVSRTPTS